MLTAKHQTGQQYYFAYDFEHSGAQHAVRVCIQEPEMLHLHCFADRPVSSANYWISANCVKHLYFSNSTSNVVPVDKNPEHAIYSSRPEYFNSTDKSIGTGWTKKPLDFVNGSLFSANYVSSSSANSNFSANCIFRISE